jgi:hypothetical protein
MFLVPDIVCIFNSEVLRNQNLTCSNQTYPDEK